MQYIIRSNREKIIGSEIISLDLLKSFLKISTDTQDSLLKELLTMSIEYAEWYMEKSLEKQVWKVVCIGIAPRILYLPFGPIINIEKVVFVCNKKIQTLKPDEDYQVEKIANYLELSHLMSKGKLEITFTAGYEKEELVPANIKAGILQHVFYVYHQSQDEEKIREIKRVYAEFKELKMAL